MVGAASRMTFPAAPKPSAAWSSLGSRRRNELLNASAAPVDRQRAEETGRPSEGRKERWRDKPPRFSDHARPFMRGYKAST